MDEAERFSLLILEDEMSIRKTIHAFVWAYRHVTGKAAVPEISVISQFLGADSVCFDVGAHGGAWCRPLARIVSNGHVDAFLH